MAKTLSQMPEMKKLCAIVSKWEDEGIKPRDVSPADMKALLYVFNDLFRYKKALFIQGALVKILKNCGIQVLPHGIGYMASRQ